MVYNVANQQRMLATVTGDNTAGYQATITVDASFQAPAATAPAISAGGIANAASGAAGVAPESWISIYGTNFTTTPRLAAASDLVNNAMPTTLGGVSVKINGKDAFVQYVSPTQINVLAPADAGSGTISVSVANASGTSNTISTTLQPVLPGLSVLSNYVRAVRYPDGAIVNGTGAAEPGYTTAAAAKPGDVLALYGTGFGATNSPVAAGVVFEGAYPTNNPVTVAIGGIPAEVSWAGLVGPGLDQINVTVPSVSAGDQPVVTTVAGVRSQSGALLKISA